jgi:hypothetical protein
MVKTLKLSLDKRLGISMSDDNFLLAAMLDPTIKLKWCYLESLFSTSFVEGNHQYHMIPRVLMMCGIF